MLVWSVVTVVGFLGLTTVVIALAAASTARYEQERRESANSAPAAGDGEPVAAGA